jgi:dipeptidyl aminopeptidase/acylaminoacyl peptidase
VAPPAAQGQTPPARGQGQGQVPAQTPPGRGQGQGAAPARGRQVASALSPDGKLRATYHDADQNLYMSNADGSDESPITTDGSKKNRIKYGTASWVYGEELSQTTAMWWSPDSRKLAYYRFDEGKVPDYVLQMKQTALYSEIDTEAYPKPGQPNPIVELFVYDIATKKSTRVDVRDGKPFENNVVGHYVYHVAWSPDGTELLFNRTNRRQNIMELTAANPDNKYFVDVYQTHDVPPATRVADATNGKVVAELAASDVSRFNQLGLKKAEMFTYKAADGKTVLHGLISFPSNFDPAMRYPTLVSVYGGPAANQNCARETFVPASPTAEYGFLLLLTAKS